MSTLQNNVYSPAFKVEKFSDDSTRVHFYANAGSQLDQHIGDFFSVDEVRDFCLKFLDSIEEVPVPATKYRWRD